MILIMSINENFINQLKSLSKHDRLEVMQILLDINENLERNHKITELAGVGKEIWQDKDAQKYIDLERANWD